MRNKRKVRNLLLNAAIKSFYIHVFKSNRSITTHDCYKKEIKMLKCFIIYKCMLCSFKMKATLKGRGEWKDHFVGECAEMHDIIYRAGIIFYYNCFVCTHPTTSKIKSQAKSCHFKQVEIKMCPKFVLDDYLALLYSNSSNTVKEIVR